MSHFCRGERSVPAALRERVTGTALAAPIKGLGAATPLYLSIPPPKQGTGTVLGIERESPVIPQGVQVMVGDTVAHRVQSLDELKSNSVLLLFRHEWWLIPLLPALIGVLAVVYYSYWRWPKHLKTPDLFRQAQSRNSEELWAELRSRNAWVDSYIVSSFFAAGAGVLPNSEVVSYFWRLIRETLSAHPVPANTDPQVREAQLEILDRSIQNAIS